MSAINSTGNSSPSDGENRPPSIRRSRAARHDSQNMMIHSHPPLCTRCQGPTVSEVFVDYGSGGGHLSFAGRRCLACGDITDSLILSHRLSRPEPLLHHARPPKGRTVAIQRMDTRRLYPLIRECPQ